MSSIDHKEIENFSKDSSHWWDENGPFKPLHRLNPVRVGYIRDQICAHFGRDPRQIRPLEGLSILDVGCGGGLMCEPLARLGANVTGVDADQNAISVAKEHAHNEGLEIKYQASSVEDLAQQYDVVLALEIIEHVNNSAAFVDNISSRANADGLCVFSTINRNPKSYALGIIAAEYLLRWVPQGTHSWKKFVKPSELAKHMRQSGLKPIDMKGMIFDPLRGEFRLSERDIEVNYFVCACKEATL